MRKTSFATAFADCCDHRSLPYERYDSVALAAALDKIVSRVWPSSHMCGPLQKYRGGPVTPQAKLFAALARLPDTGILLLHMPFHQPNIDPVLIRLWGPLQIRWYSLLYLSGFFVGRALLRRLSKEKRFVFTADQVEQWILWALIGVVIGARVVYCVVYDPSTLLADPLTLFQIYRGGLSFHGGMIGAILATLLFARRNKLPFWNLIDAAAIATPLGLFLGRMGNFLNGELWGRPTTMPWGVIFRGAGPEPRHPSQLYEGILEGLVLFVVLWFGRKKLQKPGQLSMVFLFGYALSRFFVEFFREPDVQVGYLWAGLTMGQLLSLAMMLTGTVFLVVLFAKDTKNPRARR